MVSLYDVCFLETFHRKFMKKADVLHFPDE